MTENLILLSGAGQLPEVWTEVVNQLPAGVKPRLPLLSGGFPEQLEGLRDHLQRHEIGYCYLGGHGQGAMLALRFAATYPSRVRGLVLADPMLRLGEKELKQTRSALKLMPKFLLRRRGLDKEALLGQLDDAASLDLGGDLEAIARTDMPVEVLSGAPVMRGAAEEVAAGLPQAQLRQVEITATPGAGAWFQTQPEPFAAAVARVLGRTS
ncbi:alpha/beta fold hydrolase [Corynebacterium sp. A21]|uniref:alpha/beta fold hydrolase n=1 Tax=Corynebacterium sp. A21 TaxID=3457318 RepID=UPI003FD56583